MGTKLKPGTYDCYANAEPDEPMFVLFGRDVDAPALVELWAQHRELRGEDPAKVKEARDCAANMRRFYSERAKKKARERLMAETQPAAALPERA